MSATNKNSSSTFSSFNETHSLAIRLWHWVTSATIIFTIVLVILGTFTFKMKTNIGMVQEQLERKGVTVTSAQARAVAHEYSDKIWMMHKYVGYVLCVLLLWRLLIEVRQPREEKYTVKLKQALGFEAQTDSEKKDKRHYLLVKRGYLLFYFLFLVMALTGLGLAYEDLEILEPIHDSLETLHKYTQYAIYAYILLHLIGVVMEEVGKHGGLVSGMIHGRKK